MNFISNHWRLQQRYLLGPSTAIFFRLLIFPFTKMRFHFNFLVRSLVTKICRSSINVTASSNNFLCSNGIFLLACVRQQRLYLCVLWRKILFTREYCLSPAGPPIKLLCIVNLWSLFHPYRKMNVHFLSLCDRDFFVMMRIFFLLYEECIFFGLS